MARQRSPESGLKRQAQRGRLAVRPRNVVPMSTARAKINCPYCRRDVSFDMSRSRYIQQRESEFRTRESQLQEQEAPVRARE
jgi:flagellar basal body rod protein FlgC